jgi:hypothetical protein
MSTTIRDQLVQALKARLETITVANSYETEVNNVYDYKTDTIDPDLMPAANIKDVSEESVRRGLIFHNKLSIEISIHIAGNVRTDIRNFKGDVTKAIGTDVSFGGLSQNTFPPDNESFTNEGMVSDEVMAMTLAFQIDYLTKNFDNFNIPT